MPEVNMIPEQQLVLNVLAQAKRDYKNGDRFVKQQVEQFLDSGLFNLFCDATDLDAQVMRQGFLENAEKALHVHNRLCRDPRVC